MRLLVTGAAGFLGRHVCRQAVAAGAAVVATYRSAPGAVEGVEWVRLDVTDPGAVEDLVAAAGPDAIVHTAVAPSGSHTPAAAAAAWRTNAVAPVHVARAAARHGVRLVHLSTDALHAGRDEPYDEAVPPDPVYPYGAAKAAAELGVALLAPEAVLVRASAVMGGDDGDLAPRERFMLDLAAGRATGVLYTDEIRCPIVVGDLARACLELAGTEVAGVLNVAGADALSWYEMGELVVARHGGDPGVLAAATHASAPACRPGRLVLDTTRARELLSTRLRGLREVYAR
jgi:dTDP-4-dehydrorhamnose reductase